MRVTDSDGDVSPEATLTIKINDDGPVAEDDSAEVAEDGSQLIDVFANDQGGADGVDLGSGITVVSGPSKGSVQYNGDGTFTYTADPGAEGADSFVYRLTDGDGDQSDAVVSLTIGEDSKPTVSTPDNNGDGDMVWESALVPDGSGGGSTSTSGTLVIETGNDTLQQIEVNGVNGWETIVSDGQLVEGQYGTLAMNLDGSWEYVLSSNTLDHGDTVLTDGDGDRGVDDQVLDPFQVRVTDSDGDVSPEATLTIRVNDDGPIWLGTPEEPVQIRGLVHEDLLTEPYPGNSESNQTLTASGAAGALHALVSFGADGVGSLTLSSDFSSLSAQNLTSGGQSLDYTLTGSVLTASVGTGNDYYPVFTLQVNDDGSYVFTLLGPLDHPLNNDDDGETLPGVGIDFSGMLMATDGDGDALSGGFPAGSFAINVEDDIPVVQGVQDGIMGNIAGTLSGMVDVAFGADGLGAWNLSGTPPSDALSYDVVNNPDGSSVLTATLNGSDELYFILTLHADGHYDFELVNPNPIIAVTKDLTGLTAGSPEIEVLLPINGITATFTELFPSANSGGVNSSNNGMGIDDSRINGSDVMKVAFSSVIANTSFTLNKLSTGDVMTWAVFSAGILIAAGTWSPPAGVGEGDDVTFNILEPIIGSTMTYTTGSALDIEASGFDELHLGSGESKNESGNDYRLLDITVYEEVFPDDVELGFVVGATDGDGDAVSTALNITIEGDGKELTGFTLTGTEADESLLGGDGNDILDAGLGNNILTGGGGIDIFRFSEAEPDSVNIIKDFEKGIDILDLKTLLVNEESGDLTDYLTFSMDNGDTLLQVAPNGGGDSQHIRFENVDLLALYGAGSSPELVQAMLDDQTLMVDR